MSYSFRGGIGASLDRGVVDGVSLRLFSGVDAGNKGLRGRGGGGSGRRGDRVVICIKRREREDIQLEEKTVSF